MLKGLLGLITFLAVLGASAHAGTFTTPNMSLILPTVGTQPGPLWAQNLNSALQLVDSHNHTPGSGVQIPTAGLDIDSDLQIGDFNLVNPRSVMYTNQASTLVTSADKNNVYVVNGNLYFNNASGTPVQITSGTAVNTGGSGSISGMGSTDAAVTYSDISKTFTFTQSSGVTANIAGGTLYLFENVASANSISLSSPTSLASSYALTLPTGLPASTKFMTLSSSGQIGSTYDVDNSTLEVSSSSIRVKDSGITTAKLGALSVTGAKIANSTITGSKIASGTLSQNTMFVKSTGSSVSIGDVATATTGNFTTTGTSIISTVTISTHGSPVVIKLVPDGSSAANASYISALIGNIELRRNGTLIKDVIVVSGNGGATPDQTPFSLEFFDAVGAGTYIYQLTGVASVGTLTVKNYLEYAYEL